MNIKTQTKYFFLLLLFLATTKAKSQTFTIVKSISYDTVYLNQYLLSIIKKDTIKGIPKLVCFYESSDNKFDFSDIINNYLDSTYYKVKKAHRVYKFLGMPDVEISGLNLIYNNQKIGTCKYEENNGIPYCNVIVTKSGLSDKVFEKIKFDLKKYYKQNLKKQVSIAIKTYYSEEIENLRKENIRLERERVERFYDCVFLALKNPIKDIEGVYKSIDQGEKFNYDIVILRSSSNPSKFDSYLLKSNDPELTIGNLLFTLTQTAEIDKFIMEYKLKSGQLNENKLAIFNGGVINAGIKSFVKMYPSKVETTTYNKIDTLINWDASGSGVILNNNGYLVTNYHVIEGAKKITIKMRSTESVDYEFIAKVVLQDVNDDIAILKIDDVKFNSDIFNFKNIVLSSEIQFGEDVFTLGFPDPSKLGENVKLNKGIVSGQNSFNSKCFFQTDLPVWYGNSGGPCFNGKGELIGIIKGGMMDKNQKIENVCYVINSTCIYKLFNEDLKGSNFWRKSDEKGREASFTGIVNTVISNSVFIKVVL